MSAVEVRRHAAGMRALGILEALHSWGEIPTRHVKHVEDILNSAADAEQPFDPEAAR